MSEHTGKYAQYAEAEIGKLMERIAELERERDDLKIEQSGVLSYAEHLGVPATRHGGFARTAIDVLVTRLHKEIGVSHGERDVAIKERDEARAIARAFRDWYANGMTWHPQPNKTLPWETD